MKKLTRQEEQILLAICHLRENAYLVSIRDKIKDVTGTYLDVGTIYVPLKRLHINGYLDTYLGDSTAIRGGKRIKYYRLTGKAYAALAEAKKVHERLWEGFESPAAGI